jgi:hypothetical protein
MKTNYIQFYKNKFKNKKNLFFTDTFF